MIYDGLIPREEKQIFEQEAVMMLPTRDQLGRRIFLIRISEFGKFIQFFEGKS